MTVAPILEPLAELFPHGFEGSRHAGCLFLGDDLQTRARLSYAELSERVREIAARLQGEAATGDRVLLVFPPGLDFVLGFFACLHSATVAVPVCPPRSRKDRDRFLKIIADAGPRVILTASSMARQLQWIAELSAFRVLHTDRPGRAESGRWQPPRIAADQPAVLQYTSGSTSVPRGVVVTWANLLHNVRNMQERARLEAGAATVSWLPFFHDLGLMAGLILPIHAGCSCHFLSPAGFLRRPQSWLEAIDRFGAVASGGPNFAYEYCVRAIAPRDRAAFDLSRWRVAICGGEPIRASTIERFVAAFSACGFRRESFAPCYGLAEATLMVSGGPFGAEPCRVGLDREALEAGRLEDEKREI